MTTEPLLHHEVTGKGRQAGLLLLHPLGANLRFWDPCIHIWRNHLRCVAVNLRNIVAADSKLQPVTLDQHVMDLRNLQVHLGIERLVPIGCAIGSMIAAGFAAKHPDRTEALVLSNATIRSSRQARAMLVERAGIVRSQGMAAILPQSVDRAFLNQPRDDCYRLYYEMFANQSADDYAFACLASADYDAEADLKAVRCPTLVLAGQHDVLLPPSLARDVADLVPRARFHLLQNAAHFAPYQVPAEFARLVLAFLEEVTEA
jgi:3-oxoadipate enol-lactonase